MDRRTFALTSTASLICTPAILRAREPKHVTIVGGGSAGLSAAYQLEKLGIAYQVLEAAGMWGGRIKRLSNFANVPLDLGAEWIHDEPTVLGRMLGEGATDLGVKTIDYNPQTFQFWHNDQLNNFNLLRHGYEEVKFFDTTWYGFFERFVLPRIFDRIVFNAAVSRLSGWGDGVAVDLADGRRIETDKVIVTVPLSVIQSGRLSFSEDMSPPHLGALQDIDFGSGFKVFLKFAERFYPDILLEGSRLSVMADTWASKIYYDAAFKKPTDQNILGLFTVSDEGLPRAELSNQALIEDVLVELTTMFGQVVRSSFIDAAVQNWSKEPHIMGSYSMDSDSDFYIEDILAPLEGRIFFAGEALGGDAQSTVHGAAFSAIRAVDQLQTS